MAREQTSRVWDSVSKSPEGGKMLEEYPARLWEQQLDGGGGTTYQYRALPSLINNKVQALIFIKPKGGCTLSS